MGLGPGEVAICLAQGSSAFETNNDRLSAFFLSPPRIQIIRVQEIRPAMRDDLEFDDLVLTRIRETIQRLQAPISDDSELLALLAAPLDALGILPPLYRNLNTQPFDTRKGFDIFKFVQQLQTAILRTVAPAWHQHLQERNRLEILYQYFSPDLFSSSSQTAIDIALCAYDSLISNPIQNISVELLCRLSRNYPIDKLFMGLLSGSSSCASHRKPTVWEDYVKNIFSTPTRVSNFVKDGEVPVVLRRREYFSNLSIGMERLVSSFTKSVPTSKLPCVKFHLFLLMNNSVARRALRPILKNGHPWIISKNSSSRRCNVGARFLYSSSMD